MTIKYRDNQQPRQLYCDGLVDFYNKLGSRDFWADMKNQEIALEAFCQEYMRTDHKEHEEEDATSFHAALSEFRMREKYMVGKGGKE